MILRLRLVIREWDEQELWLKKRKPNFEPWLFLCPFPQGNFPLKYSTHLGDQIRMSDDRTDKEPIVCHFCAHFHFGCPKIQVHLVISTWNGSEVKISHPVQL